MFPIYYKDISFKETSRESIYYVLANNGLFLIKDLDLYRACVKVDGIFSLQSHSESIDLKFPKIPQSLVEASMGFFYGVFQLYRSESIILLFVSPKRGFKIGIPRQIVNRRSVFQYCLGLKYTNFPTPNGYFRLGTWHSHAHFRADHSAVDDLDEENEDGLHIVCGDLDTLSPSFSVSFVANGRRLLLRSEDIFEGYDKPRFPVPERWLRRVKCVELPPPTAYTFRYESFGCYGNNLKDTSQEDKRKANEAWEDKKK